MTSTAPFNFCDKNCELYYWRDNGWDDGYSRTSPVGSYPKGASPYGALDMAGNVAEWDGGRYGGDYQQDYQVVRGGSRGDSADRVSVTEGTPLYPPLGDRSIGFRCAASP